MKNHSFSFPSLKQVFTFLILITSLAIAQGCAEYQVRVPSEHPADINYQGGTMNAWFWGKWNSPQVMAAEECDITGINDVLIKRNYLNDLISVITLGIYMPIEVNFRCLSAGPEEGIID